MLKFFWKPAIFFVFFHFIQVTGRKRLAFTTYIRLCSHVSGISDRFEVATRIVLRSHTVYFGMDFYCVDNIETAYEAFN
jgi:hypothetical protein